jgi:hypothetical protein
MKKLLFLMIVLAFCTSALLSQTIADYTFSTATDGSLEDMSTGTTDIFATGTYRDDTASTLQTIGFDFKLGATTYSQFSINSNGQMQLGSTVISGGSASPSSGLARLAALSGDNSLQSTGKAHYKVTGAAPDRVCVIEWNQVRVNYSSSTTGTFCTFQVWLYETSNTVKYVYGTMYNMSTSAQSRGVYISTTNVAGNVGNVTTLTATPTWTTNATTVTNTSFPGGSYLATLNGDVDGARRVFTFAPPVAGTVPNPALIVSPADATTDILTTATLNWSSGGGMPDGYKLYFGTDNPPTNIVNGTDLGNVTTYDPADFTYSTDYYWQVVAYNAFGDAEGSPVWSFTAMPDPSITTFPYTENFDGVTAPALPLNWSVTEGSTGASQHWKTVTTDSHGAAAPNSGTNFAYLYCYLASTSYNPYSMITPPIVLDDAAKRLSYYYWVGNATVAEPLFVDISTDLTNWTTLYTHSNASNTLDWYQNTISLAAYASSTVYLRFRGVSNYGSNLCDLGIDDVVIENVPDVPILTIVPTTWDFETLIINNASTKQFTFTNTGAGTIEVSDISITGDYYTLTENGAPASLTSGQSATFTVQYAPTVAGTHEGTVTITSDIDPVEVALTGACVDPTITVYPHLENFDDPALVLPALPLGWATKVTDISTYGYVKTITSGYSTPNRVALYNSSDAASDLILISPPIDPAINTLRAKFWAYGGTNFTLQVGTVDVSGQSAVFTAVQTVTVPSGWAQYSVSLAAYTGTDQYIAFRHGQGGTYRTMYIDDITFEHPQAIVPEIATLVAPADGMFSMLNPLLSWAGPATGEPATGYKVYLNDNGTFGPADLVYTGTNTTYQVTGNGYGRTYYWSAVPFNATGDAVDSPVWSYMTPTANQLAESFEATTFPPAGWANGTTGSWLRSTSYKQHGTASAYKSGSTTTQYVLSTPRVTITASSTLNFWAAGSSTTTANLEVVYSADRVTWTQIGATITYAATYTFSNQVIDLSSLAGNNYYLGFRTGTAGSGSNYIDAVFGPEITPEAPAPVTQTAPADLAIDQSILPTLTWTAASTGGIPTGYKVYCGPNNPPTTLIANVTASPYTFTANLSYNTSYNWMIVPNNGSGDAVGNTVRSFTTMADPTIYVFPYAMDFDNMGTTFPPTNWSRLDGLYGGTYASGSQWLMDDWLNVTTPTNKAAKINIYGASRYGWLITPPLSIPATNYQLEFDAALLVWNGTTAPAAGGQADDKFIVVMSDSPTMTNPTIIREWNNTGSPFVFDAISAAGTNVIIPLTDISGVKYIAFYGESTVSNGDNDFMIDNVRIREIPVGTPDHVTLVSPADAATGINPAAVTLDWDPALTGGPVAFYSVYVSTSIETIFEGMYYETPATSLNLSAQEGVNLGWDNTYYWAVLPVNSSFETPDIEAPEFRIWSFTTDTDPTIVTFPYSENFDGVSTPNLPDYWSKVVSSTSTANITTSTSTPVSSPNLIYMYTSGDANPAALRLITPPIGVNLNTIKTKFYARGGTGYTLIVGTVDDPTATGTFTPFQTINLTSTNTQYTVSFDTYVGTDSYIAFKHGGGGTYRSVYIDNFELLPLLNNDLSIGTLTGPLMAVAGTEYSYNATVTNTGLLSQNAYTVKLKKAVTNEELASLTVSTAIAPAASAIHTINWTPAAAGEYSFYAEVILAGDMLEGNNTTAPMAVAVYSANTFMPTVGDVATATTSNTGFINVYWKNSISDAIYTGAELMMSDGTIQAIVYQNNFTETVDKPIQLWMQNTTVTDLSSGWLDIADYTLVYEGVVTFPIGINAVVIPLQTPFVYTGANLAVRAYSVWEDFYSATTNHFYYTESTQLPNRFRDYHVDGTGPVDPTAFSGGFPFEGTLSSNMPNTMFIVDPATQITTVAAPANMTIVGAGANVTVTWDAVPSAYAYIVYESDTPDGVFAPVALVYTNAYTATGAAMKFYMVKSTTYRGATAGNGLMLNPARTLGIDNSKFIAVPSVRQTLNKD